MKRSDFIKRRSPNVVSVGDHGLTRDGRRFTIVAILPMEVEVVTTLGTEHYTYREAAQLLSA